MSKTWQAYAKHILDTIAKIRRIEARGDITQDEVLYDATLRNLQTLSEATQLLPSDKKAGFPAIPWREISGFRNILVHNYLGTIDPLTIAAVVEKQLGPLEACVRSMLADGN
ncbi:MAG: HepT-like ribonuclease domain-containing protein [Xanthomonadaceae bacterium]|nr:HepT-like ribonuclease domain-containing protein [Xanthomonadaceae bacterium]